MDIVINGMSGVPPIVIYGRIRYIYGAFLHMSNALLIPRLDRVQEEESEGARATDPSSGHGR